MSDAFFQSLNYSAAHEDGASELRALAIKPTDRVACIAGSGARPLELLLGDPREVLAIDMNPAQLALLELKMAGLQTLTHPALMAFLGVCDGPSRNDTYLKLRDQISAEARQFWDARRSTIASGVLYAGRWDRKLRLFARLFACVRRGLRDRLFACQSIDEQAALWQKQWETRTWDLLLKAIFNRTLWRLFSDEPGANLVAESTDVPAYLKQRFRQASSSFLFHRSAWAWLAFYGRYWADRALPLYLQPSNFEVIRDRIGRVRLVRAPLTEHLESIEGVDAFSISDVSSYMTESNHQRCWRAILHAASDGARACERRFLVRYDTEWTTPVGFRRDVQMESTLNVADQSIVYDFVCGSIEKNAFARES